MTKRSATATSAVPVTSESLRKDSVMRCVPYTASEGRAVIHEHPDGLGQRRRQDRCRGNVDQALDRRAGARAIDVDVVLLSSIRQDLNGGEIEYHIAGAEVERQLANGNERAPMVGRNAVAEHALEMCQGCIPDVV